MKIIINFLVWAILFFGDAMLNAQSSPQSFSTMTGQMVITGQVGDSSIMVKNDQLVVTLNYETAEIIIKTNEEYLPDSSTTGTSVTPPSDRLLFKGELGVDRVITREHPPMGFEINGFIFNEDGKELIKGQGHLEHIFSNQYACILNLKFKVAPSVLSMGWPGEEPVEIRIIQTILK